MRIHACCFLCSTLADALHDAKDTGDAPRNAGTAPTDQATAAEALSTLFHSPRVFDDATGPSTTFVPLQSLATNSGEPETQQARGLRRILSWEFECDAESK